MQDGVSELALLKHRHPSLPHFFTRASPEVIRTYLVYLVIFFRQLLAHLHLDAVNVVQN